MNEAPFGSWKSSISSSMLTAAGVSLGTVWVDGDDVYWTEGRPLEGGRTVVVRNGVDLTPLEFNARTRVHEYGGGSAATSGGRVFFSNFRDQRLYVQAGGSAPRAITPASVPEASVRYADARITADGAVLVCVRERHEGQEERREPINELVSLPTDGSAEPRILASGHDFYASPRLSRDGRRLLWLTWDHPNMPWDGTELWVADFDAGAGLSQPVKIAGGPAESIFQPEWGPGDVLHWISDKTGWWNLYRGGAPLAPMNAEFGVPQWVFGMTRYAFLDRDRIACIYTRDGFDRLAVLDCASTKLETLSLPYSSYGDIHAAGPDSIVTIAASPAVAPQILRVDAVSMASEVLKTSMSAVLEPGDISSPEAITFPSAGGRSAYGLYYAPANRLYRGPGSQAPPLLVMSHGGPTSAASSALRLSVQYWTSRGFAVVDVNYSGSAGYGRAFREQLNGQWGIADVEDCIAAARFLVDRGSADPAKMAIRGGSAGGYTTLCALVFHGDFAAGASHYGVGDLAALAADTHKFESRYLDRLVAPYPEGADIYAARSPLRFAERISCPVILFQGLEDKVVPPNQADAFAAALRAKQLPFAHVVFPDEGHGFRKGPNIQRAAEAELFFYGRIFGFAPADPIEPVLIEGLT